MFAKADGGAPAQADLQSRLPGCSGPQGETDREDLMTVIVTNARVVANAGAGTTSGLELQVRIVQCMGLYCGDAR